MKKISRRSFLMATGVIAASAALSACGGSSASTRERVRQIEAKALRKLRHPSRAKRLRDYLDE